MKILLIEDDLQLGKAVSRALEQSGFEICWVRMIKDALAQLASASFAVVLLDLCLPDGSGLSCLQQLRAGGDTTPVLVLTARDALEDKVAGLDAGADDYVVKPFAVPELVSRIRALVRRSAGYAIQVWQAGPLTLDPVNQRVSLDGQPVSLSPREFAILTELVRSAGQVVRKRQLETALFGQSDGAESNALEVHIHHLRRKLGHDLIQTVRGVGYMLDRSPS
jgi:DNA-binding response OmpR family regulator